MTIISYFSIDNCDYVYYDGNLFNVLDNMYQCPI